jgi:Tol biopolymer transport system component
MNADGRGRLLLMRDPEAETWPAWSPDGTRLVFGRYGQGRACHLWIMRADGTRPRRLIGGGRLGGCPDRLTWRPAITSTP